MNQFNYFGQNDIGKTKEVNEDHFLGFIHKNVLFMMVADGMGSKDNAHTSSLIAINEIRKYIEKHLERSDLEHLKSIVSQGIYVANKVLLAFQQANDVLYGGFATALTLCAINHNKDIVMGHVGNTRLYLIRNGELVQMTKDHTVAQRLCAEGKILKDEIRIHPDRANLTNILGAYENVEIEVFGGKLSSQDFVFLATDGVFYSLTEEEMKRIIFESGESKTACDWLIKGSNEKGGLDNSAVMISYINF